MYIITVPIFVGSIAHVHAHSHAHTYVVACWQAGERTQVAAVLIYIYIYMFLFMYISIWEISYARRLHAFSFFFFVFLVYISKVPPTWLFLLSLSTAEGSFVFLSRAFTFPRARAMYRSRAYHLWFANDWLPPFFHPPGCAAEAELCIILCHSPLGPLILRCCS